MGILSLLLGGGWSIAGFLEKVAARAGATDVVVGRPAELSHEIRGKLRGIPWRIVMDEEGDIQEFELTYDGPALEYIDIEYDPEMPSSLEAWSEGEKRVFLADRIYVRGSGADAEAAAFRALPGALQERLLHAIRVAEVRDYRSRRDTLEVTLRERNARAHKNPIETLGDLLALSAELTAYRLAHMPTPKDTAADDAARWTMLRARAQACAERVGGKVVERPDDEAIDVRWTEAGTPTRVVLDVGFDDVEASARAEGVEGELSRLQPLRRARSLTVTADLASDPRAAAVVTAVEAHPRPNGVAWHGQ